MANVPNGNSQAAHASRRNSPTRQESELAALSRRQQYQRDYRRTHRAHLAALKRSRYKKNPTPALLATKTWIAKNRDRRRQQQQAWYQRKLRTLRAKHQASGVLQKISGSSTTPKQAILRNASAGSAGAAAALLLPQETSSSRLVSFLWRHCRCHGTHETVSVMICHHML
jgi:hypothetical protein